MDTTGTEETTLGDNTVATRRQLLDDKLSSYKHERMKRKLPIDSHLLSCAKEELALKKRLIKWICLKNNTMKTLLDCLKTWTN